MLNVFVPHATAGARSREAIREALERRGFKHLRSGAYQLSWPIPEIMHVNETRLGGVLSWPLVWANMASSAMARTKGQRCFDSWVMRLRR